MRRDYNITGTADVLGTEVSEGEVRAKLGNATTAFGFFTEAPFYGVDGFISVPNPPDDAGDACQALFIRDGDESIIVGTRDNRFAELAGSLEPGDRAIVTDGEARIFVKQVKDSVILYTVSQPDDLSMMVELNGKDGTLTLRNGGSWIEIKNDKIYIGAAGGKCMLTISEDGLQVTGKSFNCSTAGGNLGCLGSPLATPLPGINAILVGPTGMAGVGSTKWTVAP